MTGTTPRFIVQTFCLQRALIAKKCALGWITTAVAAFISPILLVSCGLRSSSTSPEQARAHAVFTEDEVVELLRTAFLATRDLIEPRRDGPKQVVIHGDYAPDPDVLQKHGMSAVQIAHRLAADLRLAVKSRTEAVYCPAVVIPHPLPGSDVHSCRLTYDGIYYSPAVVKLAADAATVAVHYMFGRDFGTYVLELMRHLDGWKVVGTSRIVS